MSHYMVYICDFCKKKVEGQPHCHPSGWKTVSLREAARYSWDGASIAEHLTCSCECFTAMILWLLKEKDICSAALHLAKDKKGK